MADVDGVWVRGANGTIQQIEKRLVDTVLRHTTDDVDIKLAILALLRNCQNPINAIIDLYADDLELGDCNFDAFLDPMLIRHVKCPICLDPECLAADTVNYCCDKQHAAICKPCISAYIEDKVNSSFMGVCPKIWCPIDHSDKTRRILDFPSWSSSTIVSDQVTAKYRALAHSVLSFVCGGCHTLKSISVSARPVTEAELNMAQSQLAEAMHVVDIAAFTELKQQYCEGVVDVDEFYTRISVQFIPNLSRETDRSAWLIFKNVLMLIEEPERQSSLHLRYLRERPRMWTPCCNAEHCFKCKTRGSHPGKTCDENMATLDTSIVNCPSCGIAITKGDGCNLMTCVCGKKFSWPEQGDRQRAGRFELAHPVDTARACVTILSTHRYGDVLRDAQAWCAQHRMEINPELTKLWLREYSACPSQACAVLSFRTASEAWRLAAELWATEHAQEVQRCKDMNAAAVRSLFLTLNPLLNQRAAAAVRLLNDEESHSAEFKRKNQRLLESARMWVSANKWLYGQELKKAADKASTQILQLYGQRGPSSLYKRPVRLESHDPNSILDCSVVCDWDSPATSPHKFYERSLMAKLPTDTNMLSIRVTCSDEACHSSLDDALDYFAFGLTRGAECADDGFMVLDESNQSLTVGSRVEADFYGLGRWSLGCIKCVGPDGTYSVEYDNDKILETRVDKARIRSLSLPVGSRVEAQTGYSVNASRQHRDAADVTSSRFYDLLAFNELSTDQQKEYQPAHRIRHATPKSSWGIFDNRRTHSPAHISASPSSPTLAAITCPKIQNGDVLTAITNPAEGWLQLSVDGAGSARHSHRIQIPRGSREDYRFTVKLSKHMQVELIQPLSAHHRKQLQTLREATPERATPHSPQQLL